MRASDTVARLGGDEFGVLLTPIDNNDGIESFVKRIYRLLSVRYVFEGKEYPLAASIGSALIPQGGIEPDKILELADQRMYAVKQTHHHNSQSVEVK